MSLQDAAEQYAKALKLGQKQYRTCVLEGRYPYLQVLDGMLDESMSAGQTDMGLVDIPMDRIVGTKEEGRKSAFASNFMPLLAPDSEFAAKWIRLCEAHLSDEGIRDPIRCYEYMGRFYVQEGNKRVSVLKSYGAPAIPGHVIRVVPEYSDDPSVRAYYAFMSFYRLAGIYQVDFSQAEDYAKLQAALGYEPEHVWTAEERQSFLAGFHLFREAFRKAGGETLRVTPAEALLVFLRVYSFSQLREMSTQELEKNLEAVWPDVRILVRDTPIAISTEPPEPDRNLLTHLFETRPAHLNAAFVYAGAPAESKWSFAHDLGRRQMEKVLGDKVSTRAYVIRPGGDAEAAMEQAISDGAQVIFATTPPQIDACRRIAVRHPAVKLLNCSLSMPYTGVRTYYGRIYEGKFITGAIAGAMAPDGRIGYVANYPILGVPASINAFALGAMLTNPRVRIDLQWTCVAGDPFRHFSEAGISVISNRDFSGPDRENHIWEWGTYQVQADGSLLPLASPRWNWGRFYEKIIQSIFNGSWDDLSAREGGRAVNYWWGMSSGVIGLILRETLPEGIGRLAELLRSGVADGSLDPFHCRIRDQKGEERNNGDRWFTPEEILDMNWLCGCVDGHIPGFGELLPMSRATVRLLGIYRDEIPPEKEGVML